MIGFLACKEEWIFFQFIAYLERIQRVLNRISVKNSVGKLVVARRVPAFYSIQKFYPEKTFLKTKFLRDPLCIKFLMLSQM